jgi:hypothetical protein
MFLLVFYVPESHLEIVKEALFLAGAGKYQKYDSCCFQTKGVGQFRPLKNAKPHLGQIGRVERLEEWKVELIISKSSIKAVLEALLASHPYEEVAYHVMPINTISDFS